jgi:hypothetical protein
MSVCLWAAGKSVLCLAGCAFSLAWTHSVEKTEWVEHWQMQGGEMVQTQVRVQGSGAGMEPAPHARLERGWWVWEPENPLHLKEIHLAASGATGQGWRLCAEVCTELSQFEGPLVNDLVLLPSKAIDSKCMQGKTQGS